MQLLPHTTSIHVLACHSNISLYHSITTTPTSHPPTTLGAAAGVCTWGWTVATCSCGVPWSRAEIPTGLGPDGRPTPGGTLLAIGVPIADTWATSWGAAFDLDVGRTSCSSRGKPFNLFSSIFSIVWHISTTSCKQQHSKWVAEVQTRRRRSHRIGKEKEEHTIQETETEGSMPIQTALGTNDLTVFRILWNTLAIQTVTLCGPTVVYPALPCIAFWPTKPPHSAMKHQEEHTLLRYTPLAFKPYHMAFVHNIRAT